MLLYNIFYVIKITTTTPAFLNSLLGELFKNF